MPGRCLLCSACALVDASKSLRLSASVDFSLLRPRSPPILLSRYYRADRLRQAASLAQAPAYASLPCLAHRDRRILASSILARRALCPLAGQEEGRKFHFLIGHGCVFLVRTLRPYQEPATPRPHLYLYELLSLRRRSVRDFGPLLVSSSAPFSHEAFAVVLSGLALMSLSSLR